MTSNLTEPMTESQPHTLSTEDAIATVIEARLTETKAVLDALQRSLRTYRHSLGPDARHWLKDLDEQAESFAAALDVMHCAHCERLGRYSHPDARFERYCPNHLHTPVPA